MNKLYLQKSVTKGWMIVFLCTFGFSTLLEAQSRYKVVATNESYLKLTGTSTIHDWEMNTQLMNGDALFNFKTPDKSQLPTLPFLNFSLEVMNLKSDSKGLDNNAHKALKTDKFKLIFYKLSSTTITVVSDKKYILHTKGNLTIAGITKPIEMVVECMVNQDASVTCTGSYALNMTDYNVEPPTFMMGAMKTGDKVLLAFTIIYQKT